MAPQPMLLALPAELRCDIYDLVFQELVSIHTALQDRYLQADDYPDNNISAYTDVFLTCKLIKVEVEPYFIDHYLPKLTLYFDSIRSLYTYHQRTVHIGPPLRALRFSVRDKTEEGFADDRYAYGKFCDLVTGGLAQHAFDCNSVACPMRLREAVEGRWICPQCGLDMRLTFDCTGQYEIAKHIMTANEGFEYRLISKLNEERYIEIVAQLHAIDWAAFLADEESKAYIEGTEVEDDDGGEDRESDSAVEDESD